MNIIGRVIEFCDFSTSHPGIVMADNESEAVRLEQDLYRYFGSEHRAQAKSSHKATTPGDPTMTRRLLIITAIAAAIGVAMAWIKRK